MMLGACTIVVIVGMSKSIRLGMQNDALVRAYDLIGNKYAWHLVNCSR